MEMIVLILAVLWLAYSNGANDNFKGVATLYGSSTTSFRKALWWATMATAAGSLVSVVAADKLISAFSGQGLVLEALAGTPQLLIAVGAGAAITIFLATWLGLPTSTTHALTGGLLGAAVVASGSAVSWRASLTGFAGPLLLSPVIAIVLAATSYLALRRLRMALGISTQTCVCIGDGAPQPILLQPNGSAVLASTGLSVAVDQLQTCVERYQGRFVGIDAQTVADAIHYISAGAVCFSRAVNDTPKIAALLVTTPAGRSSWGLGLVAAAMVLGGFLSSRRVAETMSKRITDLNPGQGLTANLVTAFLVLFASQFGLPVSTTHVSCGSIFGIGFVNQTYRWKTMAEILAAWITTLPLAAVLSGLVFWLTRAML
jgi:PiT family inorganic phosphate transporter